MSTEGSIYEQRQQTDVARLGARLPAAAIEAPLQDLMITEKSFYGSLLLHLASLVRGVRTPRSYGLDEYLHHYCIEGVSLDTKRALWGGFLNFIERSNEPNCGWRLFKEDDYGFFAMLDERCFFSSSLQFSKPAIELFFKSAEAVVAGGVVPGHPSISELQVRPLDRVVSRIVTWYTGDYRDEASTNRLIKEFASTLVDCQKTPISAAVEQTLWWAIRQHLERVQLEYTGQVLPMSAATFLIRYHGGHGRSWPVPATDAECRALLLMQGQVAPSASPAKAPNNVLATDDGGTGSG